MLTLAGLFFGSARATEIGYAAELLRLDDQRLYLWIEGKHFVNQHFVIGIHRDGEKLDDIPVADNAGAVVVSERLPDYLINVLAIDSSRCRFTVGFPTDKLRDTLFVGLPRDLEMQFYSFFVGGLRAYLNAEEDNSQLPVWYEPVLYDSDRDAEVDLSIGAVDLLLWPQQDAEAFGNAGDRLYPGADFLEFALVTGFRGDELTATALNYCLRGVLNQDRDEISATYLLTEADFRSEFPRNSNYAGILYSQMREGNRVCELAVSRPGLYTATLESLQSHTRACGGELELKQLSELDRIEAFVAPILQPASVPEAERRDNSIRWILSVAGQLPLADSLLPPVTECLEDTMISRNCAETISHFMARSARVIPLGRQRLVFVAGAATSVFSPRSGVYTVNDFYRLRSSR